METKKATKTSKPKAKKKSKKELDPIPLERLSKVGQWLRSDAPPFWDLSGLTEKEYKSLMRRVMK
ncbi:MAG: hypothetical protein LUC37_03965 [Prevotella sp.]|nr:hypothetical protein [Prevotella sp.]